VNLLSFLRLVRSASGCLLLLLAFADEVCSHHVAADDLGMDRVGAGSWASGFLAVTPGPVAGLDLVSILGKVCVGGVRGIQMGSSCGLHVRR
jgi:hypothetical protein